jgi:hypothetical protein
VLRDRAGTCIDLALLVASACAAVGLEPLVLFVPGHALPVLRFPSGRLVPLEATAVAGGPGGEGAPFERALESADGTLTQAAASGTYLLADVNALRRAGAYPPELPEADPAAWRIEVPDRLEGPAPEPEETHASEPGALRLRVPAGWSAREDADGVRVSGPSPNTYAHLTWAPRSGASVEARAQAFEASELAPRDPPWTVLERTRVGVGGVPAVLVAAQGVLRGEAVLARFLVVEAPQRDVVVSLVSPTSRASALDPIWQRFLGGLEWAGAAPTIPSPDAWPEVEGPARAWRLRLPPGFAHEVDEEQIAAVDERGADLVLRQGPREEADLAALVAKVGPRLAAALDGARLLGRAEGEWAGLPAARLDLEGTRDGQARRVVAWLALDDQRKFVLVASCSASEAERYLPLFVEVARSWTRAGPTQPAVPEATLVERWGPGRHFRLGVPADWRVAEDGDDLVGSAPDGAAGLRARSAPRRARDPRAWLETLLAGAAQGAPSFTVLRRDEARAQGGVIAFAVAREDRDGVAWVRVVAAALTRERQFALWFSTRAERFDAFSEVFRRVIESWSSE